MEKSIKKYAGLLGLVFLFVMWATVVRSQTTFDFTQKTWSNPFEESPYAISGDKGGGDYVPVYNDSFKDVRFYGKNTMTVKDSSGKMQKIVFYISDHGLKRWADLEATVGKVTADVKSKTATWESPNGEGVSEVTLTVATISKYGTEKGNAGQFCFNKIDIYGTDGTSSDAPSVSFGKDEGKTFTFRAGKNEQFVTPTATVTPSDATGYMSYASSDKDVVAVDSEGHLTFTNTKFDTEATITAKWIGSGDCSDSYNSASYKVVNEKIPTTIAFADGVENNIYKVHAGDYFPGFQASLMTEDAEGEMEYSSSNPNVASVDNATGEVNIKETGTAVITAQFKGTGVYANSNTVSYTIVYSTNSGYVFYESFDKMAGIGGNDDRWSAITTSSKLIYDNEGWTSNMATGASGCIRFGTATATGYAVTPTIKLDTDGVLTFKAGGWQGDANKLLVTISEGTLVYDGVASKTQTILLYNGAWTEYTMKIIGAKSFTIKFTADKKRFFLDEVMVADGVSLSETAANTLYNTDDVKVVLKRTMVQNEWNTLCLPFALSSEQVAEAFGEDAVIAELDSDADVEPNVLSFKKVTAVDAATPYLVKPTKVSPADGYVFEDVSILSKEPCAVMPDGFVGFVGIYNPIDISRDVIEREDIEQDDCFAAFIGDGNKLYRANGNSQMKGFRAYFAVPQSSDVASLKISVDGTVTSVAGIKVETEKADDAVYNLQGQRVCGKASGVYIKNGKKFVSK